MKSIIIVCCILCALGSNAQKRSISVNYKPSFTYFGKQNERFQHYQFTARKGKNTFNHSANILYSYQLSSKLHISTGVEFSQQGQNSVFKTNTAIPESNGNSYYTRLNYYRIPVLVGYRFYKNCNNELNIYGGLSAGFAATREDNYQHIILEAVLLPPADKRYKKQDWAIPIGFNYKIAVTKKSKAILGFEYLCGLTNSFTENSFSTFGVLSEFDNSKQERLSINFGIAYSLSK